MDSRTRAKEEGKAGSCQKEGFSMRLARSVCVQSMHWAGGCVRAFSKGRWAYPTYLSILLLDVQLPPLPQSHAVVYVAVAQQAGHRGCARAAGGSTEAPPCARRRRRMIRRRCEQADELRR